MSETPKNNPNQQSQAPRSPEERKMGEAEARVDNAYNKIKAEIITQTANALLERYDLEDWDTKLREAVIRRIDSDLLEKTKQYHTTLKQKIADSASDYDIRIITRRLESSMTLVSNEQYGAAMNRVRDGNNNPDTLWNGLDELYTRYEKNNNGKWLPARGAAVFNLVRVPGTRTWKAMHQEKVVGIVEPLDRRRVRYWRSSDKTGPSYIDVWEHVGHDLLNVNNSPLRQGKIASVGHGLSASIYEGVELNIRINSPHSSGAYYIALDKNVWDPSKTKTQKSQMGWASPIRAAEGEFINLVDAKADSIVKLDAQKYSLLRNGEMIGFISLEVQKDKSVRVFTKVENNISSFSIERSVGR